MFLTALMCLIKYVIINAQLILLFVFLMGRFPVKKTPLGLQKTLTNFCFFFFLWFLVLKETCRQTSGVLII